MLINIKTLKQIKKNIKNPKFSRILTDIIINKNSLPLFKKGYLLNKSDIADLEKYQIQEIDMEFSYSFLKELNSVDKSIYRFPYSIKSYFDFDKQMEIFKLVNKKSHKERYAISCMEIYKNPEDKDFTKILKFNEKIDYEKWNSIKIKIHRNSKIAYRTNEYKIIILVDLRPSGDDYIKRFYKNSDLVTTLVGKKKGSNITISPDFNRIEDIITVEDPTKLADVYKNSDTRLIIIGDALADDYKKALIEVKKYDRFARFMLAVNIDQSKIDSFLHQVKLNYHRDNW